MTEWAALQHAYGTAEFVPDLLRAAEEASYAVLPLLADIAERHEPAGYVAALDLAAAIVASTDGPTDPATVRAEHAETVSRLRGLAERNLSLGEGSSQRTPVRAHAPVEGSVGARLVAPCLLAGRLDVEGRLLYALGRATCPSCRTTFEVPDALT